MSRSTWRKSSRSQPNDNCVEVALHTGGALVRDSKAPDQHAQQYSRAAWHAFTRELARRR